MDPIARMVAAGAAGAAGGGDPTYVDDVFSTTLYTSNASSTGDGTEQVVTTGIDHTEGFLTWIKNRDITTDHVLFDSERTSPTYKWIYSNGSSANQDSADIFKSPTSTGFTVRQDTSGSGVGRTNPAGSQKMVSWTFRKAPGFFDVVSWSGNNVNGRQISHSLGSVPGMILIKNLTNTANWEVWHNSFDADDYMGLNSHSSKYTSSGPWNNTLPTSSNFTVSSDMDVNRTGDDYIAYVFAHDDQSFGTNSDESIIKCGSYSGSSSDVEVNLGFEPQWLLFKSSSTTSSWSIVDNMRGLDEQETPRLRANLDNAEQTTSPAAVKLTPTGFIVTNSNSDYNSSGQTFIYMAIRRPHKPPTAATEVFDVGLRSGSGSAAKTNSSILTDMSIILRRDSASEYNGIGSRLRGKNSLKTNTTDTEFTGWVNNSTPRWDTMTGFYVSGGNGAANTGNLVDFSFKRASGFFDAVGWDGDSVNGRTVSHNLDSVPGIILVKSTDTSSQWVVYHSAAGEGHYLLLDDTSSKSTYDSGSSNTRFWNNTAPTNTEFTVSNEGWVNGSGRSFVAYLFAELDGISKIGSYTGTGSTVNVDCGFTAGARFVLIKRVDSTSNWFVFDTARGITASSSPWMTFNSTLDEQTGSGNNFIDPYSSGFTVDTSIDALNASGGTYSFLAIA